jgi:hypothetical protein
MIHDFILEKMLGYYHGGIDYNTASRFALGELRSIYEGRHWAGGKPTPPPETAEPEKAVQKAVECLMNIKDMYTQRKPIVAPKPNLQDLFSSFISA